MKPVSPRHLLSAAALATLALLAACGGDDRATTTAVKVAGDSLNDGGTFGAKATVQGSSLQATRLWVDNVADDLRVAPMCARYAPTSSGLALNPQAGSCTNYAIGGAVINPPGTGAADRSPLSVVQQLEDMAAAGGFGPQELLLVDGGGNDAAAVFTRFLAAASDGGVSYMALMAELLTPAQLQAAAAGGQAGLATAGGQYMTALADRLADALQTHALARGANRVVVLNMPNVSRTPRLQAVLQAVALQAGGGAAGTAAANQLGSMATGWVQAFNARLASRFAGHERVLVVDFFALLNSWIDNPAAVGLSNVTRPACPVTGTDSTGLPTYSLGSCRATDLSANPPTGGNADWWTRYLFSDNFHATPYGNQLMSNAVLDAMERRGWR